MALNSQGVSIRRKSTVANTTGIVTSTNTLRVDSTAKAILWGNAAGDFAAANFSSGMRLTISGTTNSNTGIYTISSVSATSIGLYNNVTAQSSGDSLALTANRYDQIGEIKSFNGPTGNANVIDVTNINSTAKEKLIGLRDEGQVSIEFFFMPATDISSADQSQHLTLKTDRANRTLRNFDILFTDANNAVATSYPSGMNFDAYVSGFSVNAGVDGAVTGNVTLELTSAIKYINKV